MIGGNISALLQVKANSTSNDIGEQLHDWIDVCSIKGFLDYQSGQNDSSKYNVKIQETTHVFICDFTSTKSLSTDWVWNPFNLSTSVIYKSNTIDKVNVTSENARIVIEDNPYQILMIDNPMGLNQHLEFYLKYLGGGLGVN